MSIDRWLEGQLHPPRDRAPFAGRGKHVHQVVALSRSAGIDLYKCFASGGYDLEDIPLLQAALNRRRTIPLPTVVYDADRLVECPARVQDQRRSEFLPEIVETFEPRPARALDALCPAHIAYFRIGQIDRQLVPAIVPGSIVAVDRSERGFAEPSHASTRRSDRPIYVVAHLRGLSCSYLDWIDERTIALVGTTREFKPLIYRLEDQAVVVGRVRGELRPLNVDALDGPKTGHDHPASRLVLPDADRQTFGRFLRSARESIGLTHREAHEISSNVAAAYGDRRFAIGVGSLSDWESQDELPRSIPHLISLAVCYALSFGQLLQAGGLVDRDPFRAPPSVQSTSTWAPLGALGVLPPALIHAARVASGLRSLSWNDVFRCSPSAGAFDRSLAAARYLIVNRRDRRIPNVPEGSNIDRPMCILADPRGHQICTGCFAADGDVYIQPDPELSLRLRRLPRGHVSVRGRAVAAVRLR